MGRFTPDHLPDDWTYKRQDSRIYVFDENGDARCGAVTNRGTPCRKKPKTNRARCRFHGGNQPLGVASPHFKHGRYSKMMPDNVRQRYAELLDDDELKDLSENVALIDLYIQEIVADFDVGVLSGAYRKLTRLLDTLDENLEAGKLNAAQGTSETMRAVVNNSLSQSELMDKILDAGEHKRRMVDTIEKIKTRGERTVTADELMVMVLQLANLFERVNALENAQSRAREFANGIDRIISIDSHAS